MSKNETIVCRICQTELKVVGPSWARIFSVLTIVAAPMVGRAIDQRGWVGITIGLILGLAVSLLTLMHRRLAPAERVETESA